MAEEESDQEAERLGEELVAIVESPPGPPGLRAAGEGRGGAGGGSCRGGGVGISSRDYCRRFCQVRSPSAARTCQPGPGPPCFSWSSRLRIWAVSSARATSPTRSVRVKLPPPPIRLGVGGGERDRDDLRRFRVAEKVSLSGVEGLERRRASWQESSVLTSLPCPKQTPFCPRVPPFLCFLPCFLSPHLESLATFPAFPSPPLAPVFSPFPEIGGLPSLYRPLFCHRHPSPSARVSCHLFTRPRWAGSPVDLGADPQ